ncbi:MULTISPECIES: hypothetical protein [unclassified Streptomyces]
MNPWSAGRAVRCASHPETRGDMGVTMKVYVHASLDEQRKALR